MGKLFFGAALALAMSVAHATTDRVRMTATLSDSRTPVVMGDTNLPDGTRLSLGVACPTMYCYEYSNVDADAVVKSGHFQTGVISQNGKALMPARYVVTIVVLQDQDQSVQFKLFDLGLTISDIVALHFTSDIH